MDANAFKTACRLLTRLPVNVSGDVNPRDVLPCFAVVGLLLGVGLWGGASVLYWLTNIALTTLLGGILLPVLFWWVTKGDSLRGIIWFVEKVSCPDGFRNYEVYWRVTAFQLVVAVKLLCTGALLRLGQPSWLLVSCVLSFAAFTELCRSRRENESQTTAYLHWIIAAVAVLIVSARANAFVGGVIALGAAWLIVPASDRLLKGVPPEELESARRAVQEAVDQLILLFGVLYFLGN